MLRLGLARNSGVLPSAFYRVLERAIIESPEELLSECGKSHQIGLLCESLGHSGLSDVAPKWFLESVDRINAANRLLFEVFETACLELEYLSSLVGLTPVRIKGLSACRRLYDDIGSRPVRDIDILIERDKAEALYRIALAIDFVQGRFDSALQKVVPVASSIDLNKDYEFPRMVRAVKLQGDKKDILETLDYERESQYFFARADPLVIYVPLEIHFDLDLPGRIPRQGSEKIDSPDHNWHHLSEDDELLYLCFKAYADLEIYKKAKGIKLISDIDRILRRSKKRPDLNLLRVRALKHGLQAPVDWVLRFLGEWPDVNSAQPGV